MEENNRAFENSVIFEWRVLKEYLEVLERETRDRLCNHLPDTGIQEYYLGLLTGYFNVLALIQALENET